MHRLAPLLLAALLIAPSATAQGFAAPTRAENGMVVSAHRAASEAGVEVLKAGGNAVDASVATGFALAVTFPVAGNLGGGGFMVVRGPDGAATTFDYREKAPLAATRDMFLDADSNAVADLSRRGYLASGVPGSPAGMLLAHARQGRLSRAQVLAPAIRLAEDGFVLTRRHAARFNAYRRAFQDFESTAKYFIKPASLGPDSLYQEGEVFRQPDLARVLRRIAERGPDGFYTGETADLIVAEMQRGGGLITLDDLAQYQAKERAPIVGSYRGHRVLSMPPPSSGGVALVQLLNAMEPYDIGAMGFGSSATVHLMGEAMRRVYADRAEHLGDMDFYPVPIAELTQKDYTRARMMDFNPYRATASDSIVHGDPFAYESSETTHYSVVDSEGMAVSTTTTINGGFGSFVVVDGAGFFLNNEMDDFSAKPGVPNMFGLVGNEANAIEPGKRMLSSMTPSIVEDPEGDLLLVIGTPGGSTIITTVFQVILNVIDHGMSVQQAIDAPRIHHQWLPDALYFERRGLSHDVVHNLRLRGWTIRERGGASGRAEGITLRCRPTPGFATTDPSGLDELDAEIPETCALFGAADPRGEDAAVGY